MFKPTRTEKISHKIKLFIDKILAPARKHILKNQNFTIISNNCWGGVAYEYYNLPKQSPTIGSYMLPGDYLKMVKNLKKYMQSDIEIIPASKSRHFDYLIRKGQGKIYVGVLNKELEIFFLHYNNPQVIKDKWNRRVSRINWDNLIFKFSDMNGCTGQQLQQFDDMNLPGKKFFFVRTYMDARKYRNSVYYHGFENAKQIENDTFYWNRYFDVTKFLNDGIIKVRH